MLDGLQFAWCTELLQSLRMALRRIFACFDANLMNGSTIAFTAVVHNMKGPSLAAHELFHASVWTMASIFDSRHLA
jgi:hypothetical protein